MSAGYLFFALPTSSNASIPTAEIQEAGEDLGVLLGQCLEAEIRGKIILNILKYLS